VKISLALGYRLWAEFGCKILKWEEKFMEDSFVYEAKGPTLIIHLPKEFDHHNCRNLRYETDLLMAENYVSRIIFDFTRTRFMDSSGIGILLNRYKQMKAGHTSFYGACPQVMRVLKVAGILGLMHQYESKEEAIYSREV